MKYGQKKKITNQKSNSILQEKKGKSKLPIILATAVILVAGFFIIKGIYGNDTENVSANELVIPKAEVSETAKFYPYKVGNIYMEVVAVKASDGTIRTALNTCQVCYDSGRGFYKQEGKELVCQNCGNRFKIEQVEKIKGGCNPVPIMKENKVENEENIIISNEFLKENAEYFRNWKR